MGDITTQTLKRKHKLKERFPFLVLVSSPAAFTLVSCASACVVRVNQPLGPIIYIDLVVDCIGL